MSLHSKLSPEALMSLRRQRRISTIASLVIAVLLITIMALILSFLILKSVIRETPVIVTYQANTPEEKPVEAKKVHSNPARKPSAPSSAIARVIGANAESPVAVPVPDQVVTEPSLDFGSSDDFGKGWEDGFGDGSGAGDGGGFGSGSGASGGLPGILYDLKQDRGNKPLPQSMQLYGSTLLEIQEGFRDSNLNKYFRAPKVLYLTHLAVPLKDASEGPSSFNAQDSIKPTYWMAHYSGTLVVPRTGTYRFSGTGDNYLHVRIDGKTCLHFGNSVPKGWQPTPPTAQNHQSPYVKGWHVHYGDWLNFRAGQEIRIDLGIGESGGGMVGFILQIEERGGKYRTDTKNNNRPILPLFTTAPFSSEEIQRLRSEFGAYEIDFTNVPVFRLRR